MPNVYTHGRWVVRPGQEDAFVEAWTDLARSAGSLRGAHPPTLLRDRDQPNVFLTFGAFDDDAAVEAFRTSDLFRAGVDRIRPLLESFEPSTLDEVPW
jgi:quinol monooxygenase YgiN